ncbi:hypothetical protein ABZW10_36695 [Kitasatospora sp. NPDC004723]|uniref:hypothetical protein n=1 Tax=Kitasatospora sp. NPDC004723 TaxID=3154288 RepID=UPI0033AFC23C
MPVPGQRSAGPSEEHPFPDAAETTFVTPAGQMDGVSLWDAPVKEPYDDEYGQDWPECDPAEAGWLWETAAEEAGPAVRGQRSAAPVESADRGPEPESGPRPVLAPLALSPGMRLRLRAAVRALLAVPGLAGAPDPVRLAAVVLMSRTPHETRAVVIRKGELGRWLGLSAGRMKAVLRMVRDTAPVSVETFKGDYNDDQALECRVGALEAARGVAGHPLNLTRKELAVLLRLVEVLFAPGWATAGGGMRDRGLLAGRTGRGAATDRLAALLLVLEAGESGRVRLCGGKVSAAAGRPAATLARMLGCTPAGAVEVLARLAEFGLVERPRRGVSGLLSRSRIVLPAVAAAHRAASAGSTESVKQAAPVRREAGRKASADVAGDLGAATPLGEAPVTEENPQVSEVDATGGAEISDLGVTTPLHASHSRVVEAGGDLKVDGGFSGVADVVAEHRRPERADVREDHPGTAPVRRADARPTADGGVGGPLRRDKPNPGAIDQNNPEQQVPVRLSRRAVPRPPQDLVQVLAPVECLWERLDRAWSRRRIVTAVRDELAAVDRLTGGRSAAAALADRLRHRLHVEGGSALVSDPVGWLLAKGLPQHAGCKHPACDDGIRLDTRTACVNCEHARADRRSRRRALVREAVAQLPAGTDPAQRRAAVDAHLHQHAMLRAEQQVVDRRRAEQRRAEADARRAERRMRAEAAEAARRALPCEDCGTERAGGLCGSCWARRSIRAVVGECVDLALAACADLADHRDVNATARRAEAELRAAMAAARPAGGGGGREDVLGSDLQTVRDAVAAYRADALARLARTPLADAEADLAHDTALRANRHRPTAQAAADQAAEQARVTTARYLLLERLGTVQALRERASQLRSAAAAPVREAVNA